MYRLLPSFEYVEPETIEEVLQFLSTHGAKAEMMASGTDLIVSMSRRQVKPDYIVYINNIAGLNYIEDNTGEGIRFGALTTHEAIFTSPLIKDKYAVLATACSRVGTPHIRTMGTIGGNVCMAGPSQDSPPALLALDARLKLVSAAGERIIPIDSFFLGPWKTAIKETELLTEIQIPALPPGTASNYQRIAKRNVVDEALAGVAVVITLDNHGNCKEIRIGLCSVAPTPMRARNAEEVLKGHKLEFSLIEKAAKTASEEARPRSRADQRRHMVGILLKRAINEIQQKIVH